MTLIDFMAILVGLTIYTSAIWVLGWAFGVRTFKDRNQKFIKAIEMDNKQRDPQSQWFRGYQTGIGETLSAMRHYLDSYGK